MNSKRKMIELAELDKLLEKSELTEADAERIGHKIKHELYKRLERKFRQQKSKPLTAKE